MAIVTLNVSTIVAPAPVVLQETGALISQGATTLATNSYSLLTQASSLTSILAASLSMSSLNWSAGTVTATTAAAIPGLSSGDTFITTIAGVTPTGYNGTYLATVTGSNTFTYALATNPGAQTVIGTYTPPNQGELQAMVNTFFGQGTSQSVYVLELGPGDAASGPTALANFITTNPTQFYSYLVPRLWDGSSGLLALIAQYESQSAKQYFFVTTTTNTYTDYTNTMKDVVSMIEAPGRPLTEFSLAAVYQKTLNYSPTASNRMTPLDYSFLYGVTAYPSAGNSSLFTTFAANNTNWVTTGAEGGLSTAMVVNGTTESGFDFSWWYSTDWIQLWIDRNISNAVINGSNSGVNPLYYNQSGINYLQQIAVQTVQNAVTFGLANGGVMQTSLDGPVFQQNLDQGAYAGFNVVNAVPFINYTQENPSDYGDGRYAGFTIVYIPMQGFRSIVFNVLVTNLIGQF
jgi:hypothetical protein